MPRHPGATGRVVAFSVSGETLAKMREYDQHQGCAPEVIAKAVVQAVHNYCDL